MSDSTKPEQTPPAPRPEERQLSDEALESVAGGIDIGGCFPDPMLTIIDFPGGGCFPQPDITTY